MNILMLSIDKNILVEGSSAHRRMLEYGSLFEELHIVVYTPERTSHTSTYGNVFIYPSSGFSKIMYFWNTYRICKQIIRSRSDMFITSQDALTNFLGMLLKSLFRGTRLQVQIHTDFLSKNFKQESFLNVLRYFGYVWGIKYADCIRVVSDDLKDKISKQFKIDLEKIIVLPIFVDIEHFKGEAHNINLKKKYPDFSYIFLIVSRLSSEKSIPLALEGMKDIVGNHEGVGLVIVGNGPEKRNLEKMVEEFGIEQYVFFLGWSEDPSDYFKTADAVLVTSEYEGYGITIIEALAAGKPVLARNVGVAKEAGAVVTTKKDFAKSMINFIDTDKRTGQLEKYPFKTKQEFLEKFKKSFEICQK